MSATRGNGLLELDTVGSLHWAGVVLAAITGVLHLFLGFSFVTEPMGWSFIAAGVGFLAGCLGVLANYRRRLLYLLGIPFTAGQVVVWYVVNAPDLSTLGIVDKVIQVALVAVLVVLYLRES